MELPDRSQARSWEGKDVVDRDGQRLGRCVGVFADTATGVPEWLHVDVEGHVRSFVPALEAAESDGTVRVRFPREAVLGAPSVGDDEQLSKAEEVELYRHYGVPVESGEGSVLPASDASATTGATPAPAGGDTTAPTPSTDPTDDVGTVSGGDTTGTGERLPVLDPAVASTAVPEQQVTDVDEQERPTDAAASGPALTAGAAAGESAAAEPPRPTLRPVPPASPPTAQPAGPSSDGDLSALTPLGAVAGVAAAVALVLRARDRRERRRNSAAARAGRLGDSLRAGSALALASAGSSLAGASQAAELTRRSAVAATGKAAKTAARQQERAAAAGRRQRAQTAAALSAASKTATSQKKAAARTAAQQRKAATAVLAGASSRSSSTADSVVAVPRRVAKRGRKVRRSLARKLWNTVVLGAAGGGYVLGAKAGRQRYDELAQVAGAVAQSPKVQSATETVTDPERRADLLVEVQQQASALVGRRGEPRS